MWKDDISLGGNVLRQLHESTRALEILPRNVMREMLQVNCRRGIQNLETTRWGGF